MPTKQIYRDAAFFSTPNRPICPRNELVGEGMKMTKYIRAISLSLVLLAVAIAPAAVAKKLEQTCTVKFAFAYTDRLDNDYRGIQGKQLKQVEQKVRKYGDVCYTVDDSIADYIFYVHTKPAVYHGVRTTSSTSTNTSSNPVSGTITDEDGNRSNISGTVDTTTTTTSTSSVPYQVDYSLFILDIMVPVRGPERTTYTRLHTLDQKGLYNTIYGIGYGKGKNPIVNVIDAAAKWLHENNLGR